jgi:3-hydroxymyristoyl/3-hydroxydecanoyl-(acyl carrier protein) dehydratase
MEEGKMVASVTTAAHSPWFSGHFPDDPVLPGIAQLKMVVDLIAKAKQGKLRMTGLSRVKFRKIVRPEEVLDIHVTCGNKKDQYTFKITSGDEDVCSGWMYCTQDEKKITPT